jgi:urate oxidase
MAARLGANRYGKDGIRLVLVDRGSGPDTLRDVTVDVRLTGDFDAVHVEGDNSSVLPTDTMRSTVYALAQEHLTGAIEAFALALSRRFLAVSPAAHWAEVGVREHTWLPLADRPHAFVGGGAELTTCEVAVPREGSPEVTSGIEGLAVLKTTGSAFSEFLRDDLTVLAETDDRILATSVTASWQQDGDAYDKTRSAVRAALLDAFAGHDDSQSVQHTLWVMGRAVLDAVEAVRSVTLVMPNKHHVLVDLEPFGIANERAVYVATDRPFGVIEGTVERA